MSLLKEFREFAVTGNATDMAVGILVGVAFGDLIKNFVATFVTPLLSLITGSTRLASRFWVLKGGEFDNIDAAREAGAVIIAYGDLSTDFSTFLSWHLSYFWWYAP